MEGKEGNKLGEKTVTTFKMSFIVICAFLIVNYVYASSRLHRSCPQQYEVEVASIYEVEPIEEVAPSSFLNNLPQIKLSLNVLKVLRGVVRKNLELTLIRSDYHDFKNGETLKVSLNGKYICRVSKI